MTEEGILEVLRQLGLSKREVDVYIFLSKYGPQTVHSASARLKIERVQTYRTLKSLQEKGIVEATLEAPTRFSPVSFDGLLGTLIEARRSEVKSLELEKDGLVTYWKSLSRGALEYPLAKFRVLVEQRKIDEEIVRMIGETKEEAFVLTTGVGVIQGDLAGILDSMIHHAKKSANVQIRILTDISNQNRDAISRAMKLFPQGKANLQWRHTDLGSKTYPQFVIIDGEEALLHVSREAKPSLLSQADTGLWIRSRMFVTALKEAFTGMWRTAIPAEKRIEHLKTGRPVEETYVIGEASEAQAKLDKVLETARDNVTAIISSAGMNSLVEDRVFQKHARKALEFHIMAPIDLDNLEAAERLSKTYKIRSVPISYLTMLTVGKEHAFIFRSPQAAEGETKTTFHWGNVFYTNDARYVERLAEMLADMWKRGIDISEMLSEPKEQIQRVYVSSHDTAATVIDRLLENNVSSVIVVKDENPIGIINERDVLAKVVRTCRDPKKTMAVDLMSLPIVTVDSDVPLTEALARMRKTGARRIAVFKEGRLTGMLSARQSARTNKA